MRRFSRLIFIGALALSFPGHVVLGQGDELAELKAMIQEMQKTIAAQNERIALLESRQAGPKQKPTAKSATQGTPATGERTVHVAGMDLPIAQLPSGAIPKQASGVRDANAFADLQQAAPRVNNQPLDPQLKGFIAIPGTDTVFRIGGSARVDTIVDLGNYGNPNQFVPSSIPVPGEPGWDGGERSTMHAKGTRLSLELRRPVMYGGTLRVYNEYDFFDDSASNAMRFRARHFYGQAWNFLVGQTFSAFMDVDAFPDVVDYQGPNGFINRRQPQIRYTHPIYEGSGRLQVFASLEQPDASIDTDTEAFPGDSSVVNHIPDGVVGFRWEGASGHLQGAGLFRELSFETDNGPGQETFGWGMSLAGALNVLRHDKISAQIAYGEGMARYVNDLGGEGLDAALDDGRLEAIPVLAAMVGYTHQWSEHWRSTISGGYVHVDAPDALGRFTIERTLYGSANLIWQPTTSFRMGLEYLYGSKETLDGSERDAHRFNFVVRYDLVR